MGKGKAETVGPTQEELAFSEVAAASWQQYKETGRPAMNQYVASTTGLQFNADTGEYDIADNGILNEDGSVRTDATESRTASEVAGVQQLAQANPNQANTRPSLLAGVDNQVNAETQQRMGQQNRQLQSVDNAVSLMKGEEGQSIASMGQIADQAQQTAMGAAKDKQNRREDNAYLGGQIAGAGTSYLLSSGNNPGMRNRGNGAAPPIASGRPS